jgi:hypothetical protein
MLSRIIRQVTVLLLVVVVGAGGAWAQGNIENQIVKNITRRVEEGIRSGTIDALVGEMFLIPDPDGSISNVTVTPAGAFAAPQEQADGSWVIQVKDPGLLYRLDAGIKVPVAVRVRIEREGGDQGTFQLDARSACINILEYQQVGGGTVNLQELAAHPGYEMTLTYPEDILRKKDVVGTQVTFERIRSGNASVTLRVRSRETNFVQEVVKVIPECGISSESAPAPAPAPCPQPEQVTQVVTETVPQAAETSASLEASIGVTGRVAVDVNHHVGSALLALGLFGEYSFIDLGPRHTTSELIVGLRAGAGWRWRDMSFRAQFPFALTQRSNELRFGAEIVFENNLRDDLDVRLTGGTMMVEAGDAEVLVLLGVALHFGRSTAADSE